MGRQLVSQANQENEDFMENAMLALLNQQMDAFKEQFHRFELLDEVFTQFLDTNTFRKQHYSLFQIVENATVTRHYRFEHCGVPYLATIFKIEAEDATWLNIKLPNNGFQYFPKEGFPLERHGKRNWVTFDHERGWNYFTGIKARLFEDYDKVNVFYCAKEHRCDIKLWAKNAKLPNIIISYEPGSPYVDEVIYARPL